MRAVVVYESMFGNTRKIAEAIGVGIGASEEVTVVPVGHVSAEQLAGADLLVVGGPTHAWGTARPGTRMGAATNANKPGSGLVLEPEATEAGVREWLASAENLPGRAAAFDTRVNVPAVFSGRASKRIGKKLRHRGTRLAAKPESFLVTKANQLVPGEESRARAWGEQLAAAMSFR
jgi:hypothetical protein